MRLLWTTGALLAALMLSGCLTAKLATEHYDECGATSSFPAMAECGKRKYSAYCQSQGLCSEKSNAVVQYVDALALSVKNKEMSEAEARRRYAEFKLKVITDRDRAVAAALSSGPSFCTPQGPCY